MKSFKGSITPQTLNISAMIVLLSSTESLRQVYTFFYEKQLYETLAYFVSNLRAAEQKTALQQPEPIFITINLPLFTGEI